MRPGSCRTSPLAFTFIEVLFAIIILGVGMIMIAGMLPVAIKQNADTRNDLTAKVVAEGGYAYLKTLIQTHPEAFPQTHDSASVNPLNNTAFDQFMDDSLMSVNSDDYTQKGGSPQFSTALSGTKAGRLVPLSYDVITREDGVSIDQMNAAQLAAYPLAWHQAILADRVQTVDPRFQWLAFYRRDERSNVVKLVIVAMRLQNAEVVERFRAYEEDATRPPAQQRTTVNKELITAVAGGNGPHLVPVQIEDMLTEPDRVKFTDPAGANSADANLAETGAHLFIAHSPPVNGNPDGEPTPGDLNRPFRNNGRIFKLGARRDDLDATAGGARVWELQPGFDLGAAQAGADNIRGTADDVPDGSMNPTASFDQTGRPTTPFNTLTAVANVPISNKPVAGTTAWAWIIGKGRLDPSSGAASPFTGATQDLYVLSVDVTLP